MLLLVVPALLAAATAVVPPRPPAAPTVTGPRRTLSARPVYRFQAARAVSFRCAFDSRRLKRCRATYSKSLAPGRHVLRVRSVSRRGALSRVVSVMVQVVAPLPTLVLGAPVAVGPGAGVPAVAGGTVWVPTTTDGRLARVVGGTVTARAQVGAPSDGSDGFLDAAVVGGGAVWAASDAGNTIARIDPASAAVTSSLPVAARPGGLAEGGGAVWAFHFLQSAITRIDEATATTTRISVPGASAAGIAYGDGGLWLLSTEPARLQQVDPAGGAVLRSISLRPSFRATGGLIDVWWLAYGERAVWATLPSYQAVARIDAVTGAVRFVRLDHGQPFGIAFGGGSAWVATDRAILRLDGATGTPVAASFLPRTTTSAFVSVAYGEGAAWVTNFSRGTLVRVTSP